MEELWGGQSGPREEIADKCTYIVTVKWGNCAACGRGSVGRGGRRGLTPRAAATRPVIGRLIDVGDASLVGTGSVWRLNRIQVGRGRGKGPLDPGPPASRKNEFAQKATKPQHNSW